MILLRFITKWSLYFVACVAILSSCRHSRTSSEEEYKDEIVHADMLYFDFDSVNDLSHFLDSISNEHGLPIRNFVWEESAQKEICCCIDRLEEYRNGKSKYYPDSLIQECINTLSHECAFLANHESELDMTYAEWFLMLAAYYSPDITCLVHMQTPDHSAGIHNFGSRYNFAPWWAYLFLKRKKGFEVRRIKDDYTKIDRIYQFQDEQNRLYYLCSNNTSLVEFLQVLFWVKNEDDILCVAQCDSLTQSSKVDFEEIYFNPTQKAWYYCNKDKKTGNLRPVSEASALKLCLDGEKSRFIQESIE